MKKIKKSILVALCAAVGLSAGAAASTLSAPVDVETAYAETTAYTTKDIAMLGSIAGWHGNGNFEVRLTLGESDWAGESGQKEFDTNLGLGDLPTLLRNLDFFNHIAVGGKTLAEWGCTSCYGNIYWLNESEPDYTLQIPLKMDESDMKAATAAGVGGGSRLTILEGALIPSYAYLQGDATATVYRAGCDFVTENTTLAYGVKGIAKTEVESVAYVQGHDGTCGYFGVSLKGDDYAGNGTTTEWNRAPYGSSQFVTNRYTAKFLVNGEAGKAGEYGLFNLGSKGQGSYCFAFYSTEAETQSVTIPAGTLFPSYAMNTLNTVNGNPVYIMYETQTDVTFYKQADGSWNTAYEDTNTSVSSVKVSGSETDNFTVLSLSAHDYPETLDNYGGSVVAVKDFLAKSNFYTHVLLDGVELGSTNEAYLNVWGNKGAIGFRTSAGLNINKIKILAGCEIPSYAELSAGARERFVTTETITFARNKNGEFVVATDDIATYIAEQSAVLEEYKAGEFYEAEEAKRAEIIATAKAEMANLLVESDVNAVVNAAKASIDMLLTKAEAYVAQDVAMIGRVAGWHGNGNFEIRITLGACDWAGETGTKTYNGELKTLLAKLDFFNHIKLAGKTLAEWGCNACYENSYTLGSGGPQYTIMIPLSMGKANMESATAAGAKADAPITIMEGAIIPSYGYLTKTSNVAYRAALDYVTSESTKAYGIEATAKTTVDGLKYVQAYNEGCGYFGISFVGDDYLGDGSQLEINQDYYFDGKFVDSVLVNGEAGKVKYYGLFNLGEAGKGYYAFQILVPEEEIISITIPAGAKFPTRAMTDLFTVNGNPVYIMYEVEETITLYKTANGYGTYEEYIATYAAKQATALENYKAGLFREAEEAQKVAIVEAAIEDMKTAGNEAAIDEIVAQAKADIDQLKTDAQYKAEALANVKTEANAQVEAYNENVVYLAEQAQARTAAIDTAKAKIEEATTEEAILAAVAEAKSAIDALETKESIVSAAIVAVDAYKADVEYLEAQAAEKAAAVATAKEAIESATTQAAIDTAVLEMKAAIDQIKTKAQLEAEALAAKKVAANETIDNLKKDIDFDLYEEDAILTINSLYATAKAAIESAETEADVDTAVTAFEEALNEVPMKSTDNGDSNTGDTNDTNDTNDNIITQVGEMLTGCFGTVSGLSMSVVLLGFVATVLLKKKED